MVSDIDVVPDDAWLTVPAIVELTGRSLQTVRRWLQDRELVGVRRGPNRAVMVPALFVTEEGPLPALRGTIVVLTDGGMADEEIIRWLYDPDETLVGGSAIASLRAGSKSEVRRRAQEHAF
ncbi:MULTISPECIES: Rv2175c family DNA-binding protein [unclassified Ornithinimicrobium]|uniref:Rv2175c family DNA-binding protein n=1 Tax=unclassified Ornithinimicrobium TaxID=2615080 RepID=UPI0038534B81